MIPICINRANITSIVNSPAPIPVTIRRPSLIRRYFVKFNFSFLINISTSFHPCKIYFFSLNITGNTKSFTITYTIRIQVRAQMNDNNHKMVSIIFHPISNLPQNDTPPNRIRTINEVIITVETIRNIFHLKNEFPISLFSLKGAFIDGSFLTIELMKIKLNLECNHINRITMAVKKIKNIDIVSGDIVGRCNCF